MPKNAADIIFDEQMTPFILFHTGENDVVIFGDVDMVQAATNVSFTCVDGTFGRFLQPHRQLVTCHGVCWNGFSFTFAFALLPDEMSATYSTLFTTVDSIAQQKFGTHVFSRTDLTMSCDFEWGCSRLFPRSTVL